MFKRQELSNNVQIWLLFFILCFSKTILSGFSKNLNEFYQRNSFFFSNNSWQSNIQQIKLKLEQSKISDISNESNWLLRNERNRTMK